MKELLSVANACSYSPSSIKNKFNKLQQCHQLYSA